MPSYPAAHMRQAREILAQPVAKVGDGPKVRRHWTTVPSEGPNPFRKPFSGVLYGPEATGHIEQKPRRRKGGNGQRRKTELLVVGVTVKALDYYSSYSPERNMKGDKF